MESIGQNVRRLRKEAGWAAPLDAYDATGVKPSVWINIESREPGPQGPILRNLILVAAALSYGLNRRVTLDELIAEGEWDPAEIREQFEAARRDVRKRSTRGTRRGKGSPSSGSGSR